MEQEEEIMCTIFIKQCWQLLIKKKSQLQTSFENISILKVWGGGGEDGLAAKEA